ncbi:MAG: cytochrome C assembly protein [Chloroflexi bacterium RBG_16_56_11]|nr:MAG: cytochrome C assembly protein [Chloroflexi bacterium RBG_16_56_11]
MRRYFLPVLGLILMLVSLYMVFVYVPTEKEMGIVQRIFYLMVPMGWLALLSFLLVFIGSILYLVKRQARWDALAYSSAEVGLVATTGALVVGSLWARPIWGVWWTWEPRLTATLVLWFVYLAYFMVRSFAGEESRGARFAAVIGIVGFIDLPIVVLATTLWRGMHPGGVIFSGGLESRMLLTLLVSLAAFTVLYVVLLNLRLALKNAEMVLKQVQANKSETES